MTSNRDLPPLNALRAFEAVARLRGVGAAARELHVTHGAVSRQLRQLEEALGRPLLRRQGRGLALSEDGRRLHERAGPAFAALREAWMQARREQADAPLVLGCSGSLMARWMIPRLERLQADLPGLTLHLRPGEAPWPTGDGDVDAVLVAAEPPWPAGWKVRELAAEEVGPVLSPSYADQHGLRDAPASALLQRPVLHTRSRPQAWPAWVDAAGLDAGALRIGQGFDRLYYLLEAALAGLGAAIAPRQLVADDLAAGRLLAPWGFRATRAYWILAWPSRTPAAQPERLAAWLQAALANP